MMYNDVCNGKMMIDQWMNYGDLIVGTPPKHEIIYICMYVMNGDSPSLALKGGF